MIINLKKLIFIGVCMIMCVSVIFLTTAVGTTERQVKLPILMYHNLSKNQKSLSKYTISPTEFENDMKYIQENGYTTVNLQELIAFTEGANLPEKPIIITFDDGYESVYEYAYPILKERNMHAVINILGKYTQIYSNSDDHNVNYAHITFAQIKEMTKSGLIEIGNHSYNHKTLTSLSKDSLKWELSETDRKIKAITGVSPVVMRPPGGSYKTDTVRKNTAYPIIMWSIDTRDWESRNSTSVANHIKSKAYDGAIILMHDLYDSTATATEIVVPWLINQGYQLVTVSEMMEARGVKMQNGVAYSSAKK